MIPPLAGVCIWEKDLDSISGFDIWIWGRLACFGILMVPATEYSVYST